jgi:hypothetical protein
MLLNIYKKSENEMNEIKIYESQYKIYFGYSTIYINYLKNPIYFFAYNYNIHNNSYNLFAIFKCNGNIFQEVFNKYLMTMTFEKYLNQKKINLNKKNIFQPIINSEKKIIFQVYLFYENTNINTNMNTNINTNKNTNNKEHKNIDIFKKLSQIFLSYKNFVKSLDKQTDNNLIISNIDDIKNSLSIEYIKFLKVYLIDYEQLKYCINYLKFNELHTFEKSNNEQEKKKILLII